MLGLSKTTKEMGPQGYGPEQVAVTAPYSPHVLTCALGTITAERLLEAVPGHRTCRLCLRTKSDPPEVCAHSVISVAYHDLCSISAQALISRCFVRMR